MTFIVSFQGDR